MNWYDSLRLLAASSAYEIVRRERIGAERAAKTAAANNEGAKAATERQRLYALRDREADLLAIVTEAPLV